MSSPHLLTWRLKNINKRSEMEFKKFSAGLNLETFDTILSGTNHI